MDVKVRYLLERPRKKKGVVVYYWMPTKKIQKEAGFAPCRLPIDKGEAIRLAEQFNAKLDAWYRGDKPVQTNREGSLAAVDAAFQRDSDFAKLAKRTKQDYLYNIKAGLDWAGDAQVAHLTTKMIKAWYRTQREDRGDATARNSLAALRRLLTFAVTESLIKENPAIEITVPTPESRTVVWSLEERDRFIARATHDGRPSLALAVMLGWCLGQRPADLRTLTWHAYDGRGIALRQAKTGEAVYIRCLPDLKALLDRTERTGIQIVISERTGRPYLESDFQHTFAEIRDAAEIRSELQFRDLRRTLATALGAAGCTDDQIRAITGHRTRSVVSVYVLPDTTFADGAMDRLERHIEAGSVEQKSKMFDKSVQLDASGRTKN